jgi:hypothetical protein
MPITDEEVAALKAASPGAELSLIEFAAPKAEFVVKTPSQAEYGAHRAAQETSNDPYNLMLSFVLRHVLRPGLVEAQQAFGAHPALVEKVNARLFEAAGLKAESTIKKL